MAAALRGNAETILAANAGDVERARAAGTPGPMVDRLTLNVKRLNEMAMMVEAVAELVETTDRHGVIALLTLNGLVDLAIPRGGAELIATVVRTATVPTIETGVGNCHVYIEETADAAMAEAIVVNAKVSHPSVCN